MKSIEIKVGDYIYFQTKDGIFHREDGPAKYIANKNRQEQFWYILGKLHRIKGPAAIWLGSYWERDGAFYKYKWCKNGTVHRLNAHATITHGGTKEYYEFGNYICNKKG
jgi:hypothetical protein